MNIRRTLVSLLSAIVVTLTMLGIVLISAQTSDEEPDLSYRTLDYDVAVQRNGDLKVTQHIDMKLNDRGRDWKQMYQRYTLKSKNLTDISDIGVKDVSNNETYRQGDFVFPDDADNWNDEHAGRWYIVDVTGDENDPQPFDPKTDGLSADGQTDKILEIGWNIPQTVSEDSLKFDVSMTLHGVSTAYDDVVSFQWEPFGEENQIPIGMVTGKVTFPDGVNGRNSWAWLHTENTSTTSRGDNGSLIFSADDVRAGDYLDVVAMFDGSQSQGVTRTKAGAYKQRLIDDETKQEREWKSSQHTKAVKRVAGWVLTALIGVALAAAALYFAIVSFRRSQYKGDIEYWRDLPDLSPAAAAKMEDVMSSSSSIFGSGKTRNADKLANRQIAVYINRVYASCCRSIMRAGNGVSRRAVACDDGDSVRCVGIDRIGNVGIICTGGAVRRKRSSVNAYGEAVLYPKDELLRNVAGSGVDVDDCTGRAAPADGNRFAFTDANRVVVCCRNAHAKHGYEHRGNQKQGKHFLGCSHDLFSFINFSSFVPVQSGSKAAPSMQSSRAAAA